MLMKPTVIVIRLLLGPEVRCFLRNIVEVDPPSVRDFTRLVHLDNETY